MQIFLNELVETWLVNCGLTESELGYFLGINVDARNIHAELGKACPGNESYIPGANNGNVHSLALNPGPSSVPNQNLRATRAIDA